MAKATKSVLSDKHRKSAIKHASDDTTYDSGGNLPAGIEGGVAQIVECKFAVYKAGDFKGQPYFMARAMVKAPALHNGVPISGLFTTLGPMPVCDTPKRKFKTTDENVALVTNELRKMGCNCEEFDGDLEAMAASVQEAEPFIRFRTWSGKKQTSGPYAGREPTIKHVWNGVVEGFVEGENGEAVDETDDTGEEESEDEDESGDLDLKELAGMDDGDIDDETRAKLSGQARLHNIDPDEIDTWGEVAQAILDAEEEGGDEEESGEEEESEEEEATEEESEEEEEDDEPADPVKGEVCKYKPKGSKKPVECDILLVNKKAKTVNLKNLDDGKTIYKAVPWSLLIS